jgi:hypothetical protein
MQTAYIIPFLLNKFDNNNSNSRQTVRGVPLLSLFTRRCLQTDAVRTWDMLRSWTGIDFMTPVGSNINSPANAIYMTSDEHGLFRRFEFYLEAVSSLFVLFIQCLTLNRFSTRTYPTSTEYVYPDPVRV